MSARCPLCRQLPPSGREQAELGLALHASSVGTLRERVLTLLGQFGGLALTAPELARALRKPASTVIARIGELVEAGELVADGTRATETGRQAQVWRRAPVRMRCQVRAGAAGQCLGEGGHSGACVFRPDTAGAFEAVAHG